MRKSEWMRGAVALCSVFLAAGALAQPITMMSFNIRTTAR